MNKKDKVRLFGELADRDENMDPSDFEPQSRGFDPGVVEVWNRGAGWRFVRDFAAEESMTRVASGSALVRALSETGNKRLDRRKRKKA